MSADESKPWDEFLRDALRAVLELTANTTAFLDFDEGGVRYHCTAKLDGEYEFTLATGPASRAEDVNRESLDELGPMSIPLDTSEGQIGTLQLAGPKSTQG